MTRQRGVSWARRWNKWWIWDWRSSMTRPQEVHSVTNRPDPVVPHRPCAAVQYGHLIVLLLCLLTNDFCGNRSHDVQSQLRLFPHQDRCCKHSFSFFLFFSLSQIFPFFFSFFFTNLRMSENKLTKLYKRLIFKLVR